MLVGERQDQAVHAPRAQLARSRRSRSATGGSATGTLASSSFSRSRQARSSCASAGATRSSQASGSGPAGAAITPRISSRISSTERSHARCAASSRASSASRSPVLAWCPPGALRGMRRYLSGAITMIIWRPSSCGICSTLAMLADLVPHPLQDVHRQILVRHLAPAEPHGHLDLVALVEELVHLAHLDVVVVVVDARAHLDLLDLDHPLLLAGGVGLLLRLVLELAVVEDLADRRGRGRRDLDQVEAGFLGPASASRVAPPRSCRRARRSDAPPGPRSRR